MDFGIVTAKIDEIGYITHAENLGYTHCWVTDSQMIRSNCWAVLALAAQQTRTMRLGTGVNVPGLRLAPVTANGIATINRLAPGRCFISLGTGHTAMRMLGQKPMPLKPFGEYVRVVRGLLNGEEVDYTLNGETHPIRFQMREHQFIDLEHPIALYVAAFGPRAQALAGELGDGMVSGLPRGGSVSGMLANARKGAARVGRTLGADFYRDLRKAPGFSHGDRRRLAAKPPQVCNPIVYFKQFGYLLLMRKTMKYRMYPTKHQQHLLDDTLDICRQVYNQTLAHRKEAWEQRQDTVSLYETNTMLTQWKKDHPALTTVHSQVLQNAQERVDLAYKAFFRRVKAGETPGFPRFRGPGRYDSFTFKQSGFRVEDARVSLSKIGSIRMVVHRPITGTIKTVTVRRTPTRKWYVCFAVEGEPVVLEPCLLAIGVDVGLTHFATLSTGEHLANPRFLRIDEHALAKAQRRLAKAAHGTPARRACRKVVAHIHERIANRRDDFCHQTARRLVHTYGVLAFEALQIANMMQNHGLAKSIADVAWGQFVRIAIDKAACAGRLAVQVPPAYTSQDCSRCGYRVPKALSERRHQCPACQLSMDRDHNAAINILRLGQQSLGLVPRSPWL